MKRLLAALLALSLASSSAGAGRLLIVRPNGWPSGKQSAGEQHLGVLLGICNQLGIDYDVRYQDAAPTSYCRTGNFPITVSGYTRGYSAVMHLDYSALASGQTRAPGYNPDSLTFKEAGWPSVPQIFVGRLHVTSGSIWKNASNCSTGINGAIGSYVLNLQSRSMNLVGTDLKWKSWDWAYSSSAQGLVRVSQASRDSMGGIFRVFTYSGATSANGAGNVTCTDCDNMTMRSQATADSSLLFWGRYRDANETAPLFFVWPYTGGGTAQHGIALWLQVLAATDSVTGGALIGSRGNYEPKKIAFGIGRAFGRSQWGLSGQRSYANGGGTFCYADSCESTFVKASIDSIETLKVPITVFVNVDSVATYPYEKAWWSRLSNVEYSPEPWNAAYSSGSSIGVSGNAHYGNLADPFGANRSRPSLLTAGRYAGNACAVTDTTPACLLAFARSRVDSIWKGKASGAIQAPGWDYVDASRSRANMPHPDSFAVACLRAGFRVAIINPDAQASAPSMSWGLNGSGSNVPASGVLSPNTATTVLGTTLGNFRWAACRGMNTDNTAYIGAPASSPSGLLGTHPGHDEFLMGAYGRLWYPQDLVYYFHTFKTPLDVFTIRAGDLAGSGNGNPIRLGYYQIKWIVNSLRAANQLAWPTHKVAQFVQADDL